MAPDPVFFRDLAYVFAAAVVGGGLAWRLGQPLILGYVVGGILVSPLTPGPAVAHIHTFELFAEIGVVLLMFSIGIEFSLKDLLRVKWVAVIGGPLGIVLSVGLGMAAAAVLGWPVLQGALVGMIVSVASTMVLARLLMDRGELHSRHGRIMVGITLVEDLAVVVLIVLIPRLGSLQAGGVVDIARGLGLAAAILGPFLYLAAKVVPPLMSRVARTRSQELFLLVVLAVGLGTAAVTQAVGLSLALGAFLAGLMISESDYAHETLVRLLPLRDAFVAMFFVTVGALINPRSILEHASLLGVIVGLVVGGKLVIWTLVVWLFRHPLRTALLVAVGLTQIGEFSFILVQVARGAGHVGDDVYNATLAASLLSILINAFLVRWVPRWLKAGTGPGSEADAPARGDAKAHVVLCGFGRVGSAVAEALQAFEVPYVAIEVNPDIADTLRFRGVPCLFGDAAHRSTLLAAGVDRAALVVVALPEIERAHEAVRHARAVNPTAVILARAHHLAGRDRLLEVGATEVIQPEIEAASTLIRHALRSLALPRDRTLAYVTRFREAMAAGADWTTAADGTLPEVRQITLPPGGLTDRSLRDIQMRERHGVTVLAIVRADGERIDHPSADTLLRAGDTVKVFGLPVQVEAMLRDALDA